MSLRRRKQRFLALMSRARLPVFHFLFLPLSETPFLSHAPSFISHLFSVSFSCLHIPLLYFYALLSLLLYSFILSHPCNFFHCLSSPYFHNSTPYHLFNHFAISVPDDVFLPCRSTCPYVQF